MPREHRRVDTVSISTLIDDRKVHTNLNKCTSIHSIQYTKRQLLERNVWNLNQQHIQQCKIHEREYSAMKQFHSLNTSLGCVEYSVFLSCCPLHPFIISLKYSFIASNNRREPLSLCHTFFLQDVTMRLNVSQAFYLPSQASVAQTSSRVLWSLIFSGATYCYVNSSFYPLYSLSAILPACLPTLPTLLQHIHL